VYQLTFDQVGRGTAAQLPTRGGGKPGVDPRVWLGSPFALEVVYDGLSELQSKRSSGSVSPLRRRHWRTARR
jgi:hypothetical protein